MKRSSAAGERKCLRRLYLLGMGWSRMSLKKLRIQNDLILEFARHGFLLRVSGIPNPRRAHETEPRFEQSAILKYAGQRQYRSPSPHLRSEKLTPLQQFAAFKEDASHFAHAMVKPAMSPQTAISYSMDLFSGPPPQPKMASSENTCANRQIHVVRGSRFGDRRGLSETVT